jgi:hypothetical protein
VQIGEGDWDFEPGLCAPSTLLPGKANWNVVAAEADGTDERGTWTKEVYREVFCPDGMRCAR